MQHDLVQPEDRDHREEQQDHRAEQPADGARPKPLHGEQADQDRERQRYHEVREARADDVQTTDCGRDRDRGRDHPVAEEQPGAEDPEHHEHRHVGHAATLHERGQRHDAAIAAVVGAHDEARVLDRHLDHQRPEDQRRDPIHPGNVGVGRVAVGGEDELLRVQRAGSDVAEHDPQRAQREHEAARMGDHIARIVVGRLQRGRRSVLLRPRLGLDRPVAELVRGLVEAPFRP